MVPTPALKVHMPPSPGLPFDLYCGFAHCANAERNLQVRDSPDKITALCTLNLMSTGLQSMFRKKVYRWCCNNTTVSTFTSHQLKILDLV